MGRSLYLEIKLEIIAERSSLHSLKNGLPDRRFMPKDQEEAASASEGAPLIALSSVTS